MLKRYLSIELLSDSPLSWHCLIARELFTSGFRFVQKHISSDASPDDLLCHFWRRHDSSNGGGCRQTTASPSVFAGKWWRHQPLSYKQLLLYRRLLVTSLHWYKRVSSPETASWSALFAKQKQQKEKSQIQRCQLSHFSSRFYWSPARP